MAFVSLGEAKFALQRGGKGAARRNPCKMVEDQRNGRHAIVSSYFISVCKSCRRAAETAAATVCQYLLSSSATAAFSIRFPTQPNSRSLRAASTSGSSGMAVDPGFETKLHGLRKNAKVNFMVVISSVTSSII